MIALIILLVFGFFILLSSFFYSETTNSSCVEAIENFLSDNLKFTFKNSIDR
jgi:hypothetical protein